MHRTRAFRDRHDGEFTGELTALRYTRRVLLAGAVTAPSFGSRGQPSSVRTSPKNAIGGVSTASFGAWIRRVAGASFRTGAERAALGSHLSSGGQVCGVVKQRLRLKRRRDFDRVMAGCRVVADRGL